MLRQFSYERDAGPLASVEELRSGWETGNCRRAVQLYEYERREIFLNPEEVLCPEAYHSTGEFVFKKGEPIDPSQLQDGDIAYAERIRNTKEEAIDKSEDTFASEDEYVVSLHTAVYTGTPGAEIWHATFIEGGSCYWPLEKFLYFYKPVAVKRIA
ncbi:MAG TPA: hypothetical protein VF803_02400 [Candidatus Paceibacterota bacterium]